MRSFFVIVTLVLAMGGLALATAQEDPAQEDPGIEGAEVCASPVASPEASPMGAPEVALDVVASPIASPVASPAALDVCVTPPPGTVPATT
ncbi:MAG: hypothetical protein M3R02_10190 [Chloroflexota bacterium]|nr:hypothetical protein [Chloroflexota bacterium]